VYVRILVQRTAGLFFVLYSPVFLGGSWVEVVNETNSNNGNLSGGFRKPLTNGSCLAMTREVRIFVGSLWIPHLLRDSECRSVASSLRFEPWDEVRLLRLIDAAPLPLYRYSHYRHPDCSDRRIVAP
jgi:hypothetical protein